MLNIGTFSPLDSTSLLSLNKTFFSSTNSLFTFTSKNASFSSYSYPQHTHLTFNRSDNGLLLLRASALNNRRRKVGTDIVEMDGSDFDDDEDDDDEGMFLPFGEMKRWLESKPRGFGEGKAYDTSVEEKLLEEMEQSRQAQIANINKLKNNPVSISPKKLDGSNKASEVIPSSIRVRLINLPKKKNIHRDLKSAFEGVPGITNISPAVSGNKKTKDPICKGFAFVDFKSEEDATRFVQIFSRQSISFGKIQKQIKCELMNSNSSNDVHEHSVDSPSSDTELKVADLEDDPDADLAVDDEDSLDSWMEAASDASDPDDELDLAELEDMRENLELVSVSELTDDDIVKRCAKSATDSSSSNNQKKIRNIEKKLIAKGKVKKVPKLNVPGSAKRLRVKEKAVLTDVFSKYAAKASLTSKEGS
ncbi:uncharacterized protein LOC116116311 [Pistacia vera]|uniref:uncharacterized protein LOC116116311 n=1 Tax=Pistacia vera TaxID=55513 RepID=UPI00126396B7|nr:uncharacterized protein LOC116116311 [Pistacia vera]